MDARTESALARLHRSLVDRPEDMISWAELDVASLDEASRRAAGSIWAARATAELQSMRVMLALASRAPDAGLPLEVTTGLARLAHDEARHATLCARLADALGGHGARALEGGERLAMDEGLPARLFVARWTFSLLCVGESSSLAMLGALRRCATDRCARAVLHAILRDEVVHERVGWAIAARIAGTLSEAERGWLATELVTAFSHYATVNAGGLEPSRDEPRRAPAGPEVNVGMLPIEEAARAFHGRIERVIVPRLQGLGLDAARAWAMRGQPASPNVAR